MKTSLRVAVVLSVVAGGVAWATGAELCPPRTQWDRSYGGAGSDFLRALAPTSDGGLAAAGYSTSSNGDRQSPAFGASDVWVVRLNSAGTLVWERALGGGSFDAAGSIERTEGGGFVVGAVSSSGIEGNKASPNFGQTDYWLIRLNGDGDKVWDKAFGGNSTDELQTVLRTGDGGFLLAGSSASKASGSKTSTNYSGVLFGYDFWVVRTDADGNKLWEQSYGGAGSDYLSSAVATADGGFLLGGVSYSEPGGNKTTEQIGFGDYWIVRIDGHGDILWQRSYGGQDMDSLQCLAGTADGGFILGGVSYSGIGPAKTSPGFGGGDFWAVRIDAQGNPLWDVSYGGELSDSLLSIQELGGGGFLLGGSSSSLPGGNRTSISRGGTDYWVVRLNSSGQKVWEQSYGGHGEDVLQSAAQAGDGGWVFGGASYSRPRGGKTAPWLGESDFWIIKTAAETPGDCDGDGVPDAADLCPDTPFGGPANATGCSLAQYCPCGGPWESPTNYVACVESNTIAFVADGLITEAQRQALISQAQTADCPPSPQSVVAFGLTNSVVGETFVTSDSGGYSQLYVAEAGPNGGDGISLHLGQADSGVFIDPYASDWGGYSDAWFMRGLAYGRVNGQTNVLVATMRGTKPNYETYPVLVDLGPLAPESLTFLVWSNGALVAEVTTPGHSGGITVYSGTSLGHRVNPFWRMPDGSVGALIEFMGTYDDYIPATIAGPFGEAIGNRIFVRANAPSNIVDYVSRFDVVIGGGITTFSIGDERPGVFGRPHRALGPALIEPAIGRLQLTHRTQGYPGESFGVLAELRGDRQLNFGLEPVALSNANARLSFSLNGAAELHFAGETNAIGVSALFSGLDSYYPLQVLVYRQGILQGALAATNAQAVGWIGVTDTNDWPRIIGCGGSSETNADLAVSFTLDRTVSFTGADGSALQGDHFSIAATNAKTYFTVHSTATLMATEVPLFAITSEEALFRPPPLAIVRNGADYVISWPVRNLPVVLESSSSLGEGFTRVDAEIALQGGEYSVSLPATGQGSRFFRLRSAAE